MSKSEDLLWVSKVTLLGDKTAFDHLTRKYQSSIRRFLQSLTMGDTQLADDLAQETFIKAYLNINGFQGLSGFSTWLFRIAYNVHYDYLRSKKITSDLADSDIEHSHQIDNGFSAEKMDIQKALLILRKEERTAVLLSYMEDKTNKEVAKIMNIPLGTAKTHILKGKEKLSNYLKNAGYGN